MWSSIARRVLSGGVAADRSQHGWWQDGLSLTSSDGNRTAADHWRATAGCGRRDLATGGSKHGSVSQCDSTDARGVRTAGRRLRDSTEVAASAWLGVGAWTIGLDGAA
ncbi:hypothetical protein [Amycolatopsis sp. Poz14]|uniref:hypothetical protein n=1 Tax=Amycolatopsis sp. Poz14 TaxID=1447705 RepID=UPI001EE7D36E|nr:hypothetical protein [Amycolatopsis sp. Poz14]MCG3749164.1 hypothetical protein [Amycolatopsis sp. Poz14]